MYEVTINGIDSMDLNEGLDYGINVKEYYDFIHKYPDGKEIAFDTMKELSEFYNGIGDDLPHIKNVWVSFEYKLIPYEDGFALDIWLDYND